MATFASQHSRPIVCDDETHLRGDVARTWHDRRTCNWIGLDWRTCYPVERQTEKFQLRQHFAMRELGAMLRVLGGHHSAF